MKKTLAVLAGLTGSLLMSTGANGAIASTQAIVQNVSALVGTPAGLQTWRVFIPFTSATDSLLNHTAWNVNITGATFFNSAPVIGVATGNVPVNPLFITAGLVPADYRWDTWLSMDSDGTTPPGSEEPVMTFTPTHIGPAGVFTTPPSPVAGADLRILVAQITFSSGIHIVSGTFVALTPSAVAGATPTTMSIFIPAPGALALLGVAGLVGTRRRRA